MREIKLIVCHNLAGIYYISVFYNAEFEVSNYLSSLAREMVAVKDSFSVRNFVYFCFFEKLSNSG